MAVKTSRLLASRKVSDAGIFTPCGRSMPGGGRSRVRSMSVCSSVLPSRATATFARSLLRVERSSWSMSPLVGFSSGRELVLDERLIELAGGGEPAAAVKVILRGAQLRALERQARVRVVGAEAHGLGVLDDREVVVLAVLGVAPRRRAPEAAQPPANRQSASSAASRKSGGTQGRDEALTTSTPRGILNANSLSAKPTFSFRFVKEKARFSALSVDRDQPADGEAGRDRRPAPANRSPVAAALGTSFSARLPAGIPGGCIDERRREVARQVALCRRETASASSPDRRAGPSRR